MTTKAEKVAARETTDVDDIRALADGIVALIQTAAFDDMTWAEVDMALRVASSLIKLNWQATGTVQPAEPPAGRAAPKGTYPG